MGYLIPVEATPFSKSTYLPYSTLFSYIKALSSHHVLLISDSCYSGSIFTPIRSIETSKEKLDKIPSKWAITSGRIEPVSDGIPGTNSPFAEAIIRLLQDNNQNLLSVSELANKLVVEVAGKVDQIPRGEPLQSFGHKGGEFILRLKKQNKDPLSTADAIDDKKEILELLSSHYKLESSIEDAENENKMGTVRRLTAEKTSLMNILNRELLKDLEINKDRRASEDKFGILSTDYMQTHQKIVALRNLKNETLRNQRYEKAAEIRDEEKQLEADLRSILKSHQLKERITFSASSIYEEYHAMKVILETQNIKFQIREEIERFFAQMLFLDMSFSNGFLSNYVYHDLRDSLCKKLKNEFIDRLDE